MCNEWQAERRWREYCEMMQREALGIVTPEPGDLPFGSVKPSDPAAIITALPGGSRLDVMPWGWIPNGRKGLIINVRSEGRRDPPAARGIAIFDKFFEHRDDGAKLKSKFAFSPASNEPMALAVVIRNGRFALLTGEPGPDVSFVHHRTPIPLKASAWPEYLTAPAFPAHLMAPTPEGTLRCVQVR